MSNQGFISELKRRNVIRMAGLYLVGAWLVTQVAGTVLPMFGAPEWIARSVVALLAIGFVPVLVFSWAFELTPEGIKRDADVAPADSIAPQTARRMDRMIIAILLLAIVYFGFDRLVLASRRDAVLVATTTRAVEAKATAQARPAVDRNSIAVLPFVNMSGDKDNEYFSDGISEEILNKLAQIPRLQVAARTSSFSFKGVDKEVPQIARELGVRMMLEGSVRKQGDRVRITAQLIDAGNGFHAWSQTYDREIKDIFAIQDEIAKAIADELKVKLEGATASGRNASGTSNVEAYDLYLRGLGQWQSRTESGLWAATESFKRAIAADPEFAQAWAGLALTYAVLPDYSGRISYEAAGSLGREAVARALLLNPDLPESYTALAHFERVAAHGETAVALLRRAIKLRPSFATAHQWLGTLLVVLGEVDEGIAETTRASELDPRSVAVAMNHAYMLMVAGRNKQAVAACEATLAYAPDSLLCPPAIAMAYLVDGNLPQARRYYGMYVANRSPAQKLQVDALFDALAGRGDRKTFSQRLSRVERNDWNDASGGMPFSNIEIPQILVLLNEKELAISFLQKQPPTTGWVVGWAMLPPVMDPVRCDQRFQAILVKAGVKDLRATKHCGGMR